MQSVGVVRGSLAQLQLSLARAADVLDDATERRLAGGPLAELVQRLVAHGGSDARLASYRAFHEFEHAMKAYRAAVVRSLVDDEAMTFTQVGELLGVSRQMIARLYATSRDTQSADRPGTA